MFAICFGSGCLGLLVSLIFSLLFINFDKMWKKILTSIISTSASGAGLWGIFEKSDVTNPSEIFISIGVFCCTFLVAFIVFMVILCKLIKDKDDTDVLRIRDIILGQKQYIQKYYQKRENEIDNKLNIEVLQKREKEINLKEQHYLTEKELLECEKLELEKIKDGKLRVRLPENKNLAITKEFLDLLPSYVEELSSFIEGIKTECKLFNNNHDSVKYEDMQVFLTLLSLRTLEHLFGKGAKDVRVHFRFYNEKRNGYEKIVSVIGEKESKRDLTFIPYDKDNMINKSFECKRALIKSHNIDFDFEGNNSTTWTEYITYTFYNITRNNKPCLSFGISVKNATKYKHLLNFLNYCKFESYLQEVVEEFNDSYNIETILYDNHNI